MLDTLGHFGSHVASLLVSIGTKPSSLLSFWALATSLILTVSWLTYTSKRIVPARVLIRALFPRKLLTGRSAKADWAMTGLGYLLFPILFAASTLALASISSATLNALALVGSAGSLNAVSPLTARIMTTVLAFLAFEFGYYFDHYLKHRVPFFWHFHKVHHAADTLTPLTVFRVHPVDSLIYANISVICTGATIGLCLWIFGPTGSPFRIDGMNAILLVFAYLLVNLQHTQMWIPFRGWLGKTLLSPAHHQIHHSADPRHFNSNYGNIIALWDVMFRTLHIPEKQNPMLAFGVAELGYDPHSATGLLIMPIIDAFSPERQAPAPALASQETGLQALPTA